MVLSSPSSSSLKRQRQRQRVIVLGAGISGLACAKELQQRGYDVLVIEARQRVGGRLKGGAIETLPETGGAVVEQQDQSVSNSMSQSSTAFSMNGTSSLTPSLTPSLHVDLGGALIHGIIDNPVYSLVQQMGIPVQALSDTLLLDSHGWPVDAARDDKVSTLFNDCLEESFRRITLTLAARNSQKSMNSSRTHRRLRRTTAAAADDDDVQQENQPTPNPEESVTSSDGDKKQSASTSKNVAAPISAAYVNVDTIIAADMNEEECDNSDDDNDNYGHLFRRVCREKNLSTENNALWKWHQANLEVSCGASFDQLGYTWNEDEAYGFDGDHVALSTSWKTVMEGLADGLEILMASPVTRVCRVDAKAWQAKRKALRTTFLSSPHHPTRAESEPLAPKPQQQQQRSTPMASMRRSRRLMGEGADLRRSSRATKGQLVEPRLTVSSLHGRSYDHDHTQPSTPEKKRGRMHDHLQDYHTDDGRHDSPTQVQVTLRDGIVLEANAVVCTLPLAILKIPPGKPGHVEFYPPLPQTKQGAIARLGCGILNKCALSFPRIFWQDVDFLGLASEVKRPYLIVNVAKYTSDHNPILIFMYGGAFAKEIEDWKDSDIVEDCMSVLRALYGQRDVVPDPLDYLVTRWGHEQFSRMAFTYIPPGVDGMQELERMSEAVYDTNVKNRPVIMFAGEHTTPFHPSTIHGAFLSGIREAYRLDLAIDPEANGNLIFTDDQLYQRTFAVRKKVRGSNAVPSNGRPSQPAFHGSGNANFQIVRHRRRCIAGAMHLRRNPKTVLESPSQSQTSSGLTASRRSQRSLARRQMRFDDAETKDSPGEGDGSISNKCAPSNGKVKGKVDLHALEDRMLVRSVESFGRDFAFIRSKVLPVHGSSRRKNPAQLRARHQSLVRATAGLDTKSDHVKAAWEANEPFVPPLLVFESGSTHNELHLRKSAGSEQPTASR